MMDVPALEIGLYDRSCACTFRIKEMHMPLQVKGGKYGGIIHAGTVLISRANLISARATVKHEWQQAGTITAV